MDDGGLGRVEFPDLGVLPEQERRASSGPLSPHTVESSGDDEPNAVDRALAEAADSGEPVELVERRTETTTTYANPDGTFTDEVAAGPVRVEVADGEWAPVDPNLEVTGDGVAPVAVPNEVEISGGGDGPLVSLTHPGDEDVPRGPAASRAQEAAAEDKSVVVEVPEALPEPTLEGTSATFAGVLDGADLVVTASTVGTEVSVVIPEPGAGRPVYELPLSFRGLEATQDEIGGLVLRDSPGAVVGYSPAPIMFDATGEPMPGVHERYGDVGSELVERDGQQVLVVTPDPGFLDDPATQYPVTIDPATDLYPSHDTFVHESLPNQANDSATTLYTGYGAFLARTRAFIRFDTSSIEGQNILSGELNLYQRGDSGGCTASLLQVYETQPLAVGATWTTQPAVIGGVRGSAMTAGDETSCPQQVGFKQVDITSLVGEWAANPATHGTVSLRSAEAASPARAKAFRSRETIATPFLRVSYLTTPSTPTQMRPAPVSTEATLRPVLSAQMTGGDGSSQIAYISLRDAANTEIGTYSALIQPGNRISWTVPDEILRAGQAYTWEVWSCVGFFPQFCSSSATAGFTVSPGLAAGDRPFFTYTGLDVTDRSTARVNVASGSLVLSAADLSVEGINGTMALARTYNSFGGGGDRMLGHGWSASYTDTVRLESRPDGSFVFHGESGEVSLITDNGDGTYSTSGDLDADFFDGGGFGVYLLRFNHDRGLRTQGEELMFYNFGVRTGLLYGVRTKNGQGTTVTYPTGSTEMEGLVDTRGRGYVYDVDGAGHLVEVEDATGNRSISYGYDAAGRLTSVTDLAGGVTTYAYGADHDLTEITDPNGGTVRIAYDGASRVVELTRVNGGVDETTTFAYTDPTPGNEGTTVVTDANGQETTYRWDHAHRVRTATDPLGKDVATDYDVNSNVTTVTDAAGLETTFGYDLGNRNNLESVEIRTGATSTAGYPGGGSGLAPYQPTSSADAQENSTSYAYDVHGNLETTVNSLQTQNTASTSYENHPGTVCGARQGQVCSTTDARGHVTSYGYDSSYHLTTVTPAGPLGSTQVVYDALSRVTQVTDGNGNVRTFGYDAMDRIVSSTATGGLSFTYGYDANGNQTSRTEPGASWTMSYDEANRLTGRAGPEAVSFAYDPMGNVESVTDINGTTTYGYTAVNMLSDVWDHDGERTRFTYHPDQPTWRTRVDYPTGVSTDITRDGAGRIERVTSRDVNGTIIGDDRYEFSVPDGNGGEADTALRQTWTNKDGHVLSYDYDELNRLVGGSTRWGGVAVPPTYAYEYDGVGNRTSATKNGQAQTWSYNPSDQISGATHDGAGNVITSGYGVSAASYNGLDQTVSLTPDGGSPRAQSFSGTGQAHWRSDGGTEFETALSLGITYLDDGVAASGFTREPDGTLVSMHRGGETFHYVFDGRGSVTAVTDSDGEVVNTYTYDPYGEPVAAFEAVANPWRWNAGYTLDGAVYKFGERFYDTTIGRWTQIDPLPTEPRYAYAANDPINNWDPKGLECYETGVGHVGVGGTVCREDHEYYSYFNRNNEPYECSFWDRLAVFTAATAASARHPIAAPVAGFIVQEAIC